ncbi:amino acid carrier protein [Sediminibacter sp. Hel_I_10]|uniref:amino acid carrier protein n=1 Tax=Sediminibacter sp. Hel_I_10 TaxID=1392490 RepID=UPI00056BD8F0|nr:amino acid carrier protein [Sediminibacter sp. Hel_I_10]
MNHVLKSILFSILITFSVLSLKAQEGQPQEELAIDIELINPTSTINDGQIEVTVKGGNPPYTYQWSDQDTPLSASKANGLIEGVAHSVTVSDAQNRQVSKSMTIEASSITENFNAKFSPIVEVMSDVLFWDPFAAVGLYDPVVYTEKEMIKTPLWTATTDSTFVLKKKLVKDGALVKDGDDIAIISIADGAVVTAKATAAGTVNFNVAEGNVIFSPNNTKDLIEQGAQYFASISFDEEQPLLYPNGEVRKNRIPFIVIWLIFGATFFTFRMGFINIRGFKHAIDLAKGKYSDPDAPGKVTHFQALSTAVSATVGLGNIAGVAVAISIGGAGATFWMILAGFLGMSSKFVECTLGVKYREIKADGKIFGGPMNYLQYGLEKRNIKWLGKALAGIFALLCVGASFGAGNMFQSNQSFEIMASQFSVLEGLGFWFGIGLAVLVGIVIIGGIESIAKVTEKVVPVMAIVYVIAALIIIGMNFGNVGAAFSAIYNGALNSSALKGGFIGVLIIGFQRAAFSNEAGVGSAAIAHSATKTHNAPSEGFVGLMEPFIDTVVVCTLTALVLIFTGMHEVPGVTGVKLTANAFGSVISWFPYVLAIAVFLFAFSSMISWSYYGMRGWTYLFGKTNRSELTYKIIFLVFVVVGASVSLGAVLDFSDMMILAMSVPNMIGLYILSGEVRKDLAHYFEKKKAGTLAQPDPE